MVYTVDDWYNCHSKSWPKDMLVEGAIAHPAKVKIKLAEKIYQHALEEGWIARNGVVIDPFAGIGGFACHALLNGLVFIGVELEERFSTLANQNIDLWCKKFAMGKLGTAVVLQGDSRKLKEVLVSYAGGEEHSLLCSSPPFTNQFPCQADNYDGFEHVGTVKQGAIGGKYADDTEGNLSSMPTGDLAISSPPYVESLASDDPNKRGGLFRDPKRHDDPILTATYGVTDGQLGAMRVGDILCSSPPFEQSLDRGVIDKDLRREWARQHGISNAEYVSPIDLDKQRMQTYGTTEGNLGNMTSGLDMTLSSPPYEGSLTTFSHSAGKDTGTGQIGKGVYKVGRSLVEANRNSYGFDAQNLGNAEAETFWGAARLIVGQCFEVLKPGAHAIWVCKRYVKGGEIVEFSQQWAALCESVGFKVVCWHKAWLVEDRGNQYTLEGDIEHKQVERLSFFRRLAQAKGAPRVDWEDVICMVKPG